MLEALSSQVANVWMIEGALITDMLLEETIKRYLSTHYELDIVHDILFNGLTKEIKEHN